MNFLPIFSENRAEIKHPNNAPIFENKVKTSTSILFKEKSFLNKGPKMLNDKFYPSVMSINMRDINNRY